MATTRRKSTAPRRDIRDLAGSWDTSLMSQGKSRATRETYGAALAAFADYLDRTRRSTIVQDITRADVEAFVADLLARWKPATASNRYRGLHRFFEWAADPLGGDYLPRNPMDGMTPPKVDVPVLDAPGKDEVEAIIRATAKDRTFEGVRDTAILRVLWDTGMRREECAALGVRDVDLRAGIITVVRGKGGRGRQVGISAPTRLVLDRWISRERPRHPQAKASPRLWLGRKAPQGDAAPIGLIRHVVERRSREALGHALHPHLLRHAWADRGMAAGMSLDALMQQGGWIDPTMPRRYAAHNAQRRSIAEVKRLMFGEDVDDGQA